MELPRVAADGDPEGERRDRAVPEAVAPRGRGRAEVAVAALEAHAVERRDHHRDHRAMRVADRRRQRPRRAGRVLEHREVVRRGARRVAIGLAGQALGHLGGAQHDEVRESGAPALGVALHQQHPRATVVDAERDAVRPEEREQRHRDRAAFERAEERAVEGQRRLEHDGDAISARHVQALQEIREPRRPGRELAEAVRLGSSVRALDAQRGSPLDVPVDALVGEIEALAIAVEDVPQRVPAEGAERLGVAADLEQPRHAQARAGRSGRTTVAIPEAVVSPRWLSAWSER